MAIQVNGTQVIGNSRQLTNITSVDATTAAAIGAAGVGGGGEVELTSGATISSGSIVGVRSDGKVALHRELSFPAFEGAPIINNGNDQDIDMVMLSSTHVAVIVKISGYWSLGIGEHLGNNTWNFGSFVSLGTTESHGSIAHDPVNNKIAFAHPYGTGAEAKMISYSGTTVGTQHSSQTVHQNPYGSLYVRLAYDVSKSRFFGICAEMYYGSISAFSFTANSSGSIQNIGWISSTSSGQVYNTNIPAYHAGIIYHPGQNCCVIYNDKSNRYTFFKMGISGNTPTKAGQLEVIPNSPDRPVEYTSSLSYDSSTSKLILTQGLESGTVVRAITLSGSTFTMHTPQYIYAVGTIQDSATKSVGGLIRILTIPNNNSSFYSHQATVNSSGTITISGSPEKYEGGEGTSANRLWQLNNMTTSILMDSDKAGFLQKNVETGKFSILSLGFVTQADATTRIGLLQGSATANNPCTVTVAGGINTSQSGLTTGLPFPSKDDNMGVVLSSTSVLVTGA